MRKVLHSLLLCLLALIVFALAGCGQQEKPKKDLNLCSSLGKNVTELLASDFTKNSGIKVNIKYLPAGTFDERMAFLKANKFDCWLGGTAEEYYLASQQNLLQPYAAKEAYKVPAELRSKQGYWTSLYLGYIAFISNKDKLHGYGLYAPDTWQELLAPQLKDQIAIPALGSGGASYGMLTSIWQLWGREKALQFAAGLNKQAVTYTTGIGDAVELVYSGQKTVAVVPLAYALNLEEYYKHLFATVVEDANRNLITGAALMNGAADGDEAKEFLDYLMSDGSEALLIKNGYQYMWHVKNYPYNDGRRELLGDVQVPVDDLSWTAVEKSAIIKEWLDAQ